MLIPDRFLLNGQPVLINANILPGSPINRGLTTGSPSSLYDPHKEHDMASNYKGLYGIFYKISTEVVQSENIQ